MSQKIKPEESFSIEHRSLVRDIQRMVEGMSPEALGHLAQSLYGVEFTPFGDELAAEYGFRVTSLWAEDGPKAAFAAAKRNFEASNSIIGDSAVYLREADLRAFTVQDLQWLPDEWDSYLATVVGEHYHVRVDAGRDAHLRSLFRISSWPSLLGRGTLAHFAEATKVFEQYASEGGAPEFTASSASFWPDPSEDESIVLGRADMIAALANQLENDMPPEEVRDFAAEFFKVRSTMSVIPGTGEFVFRLTSRPGDAEGDEFDAMVEKMTEAGRLVSPEELAAPKSKAKMAFS